MAKELAELTTQQVFFVELFVNGETGVAGNATKAALLAGYSEKTARVIGQQLLAKRHVALAVREANIRALKSHASLAISTLAAIVSDERAKHRDRLEAAKALLDRGGYQAGEVDAGGDTPLSEMTIEELAAIVLKKNSIDVTPSGA
ncbi:terminase small subunit [Desulfovibrio subterraneus]|uniref:Terminase small subunit n=1 Tax=Desulfovibrio subterraneus TaxID=2718620 RepID=A0A7J0BJ29_9BACT|nr:terminase small subunit [Desulfovibrio subterraneus]GFM33727.1 hypothetical protein DSM101010T_20920 [Desulfovibrio subterraneus]